MCFHFVVLFFSTAIKSILIIGHDFAPSNPNLAVKRFCKAFWNRMQITCHRISVCTLTGFKKSLIRTQTCLLLAMSTVIPIPVITSTILTAETVGIIALLVKISCNRSDCRQEGFKSFYYVFQVNVNPIFIHSTSLHS